VDTAPSRQKGSSALDAMPSERGLLVEVTDLPLPGLKLIEPKVFRDARGHFLEIHHAEKWASSGIRQDFVQDNLSVSHKGVLRGLHFQYPQWQAKLISVVEGEIFDVVVDLRQDSPTFGKWHAVTLSGADHRQLLAPAGFAHGFCVTSDVASVIYKCSTFYEPEHEHTLLWNDPDVGIHWPVSEPILSGKDAVGLRLRDLPLPGKNAPPR